MKFALITPPQGSHLLGGMRLCYHMALAQHLFDDPNYLEMYKLLRADSNGTFIIVDNGEAEGNRQRFERVVEMANEIGADEIVLPDSLRNAEETVRLTTDIKVQDLVPPIRRFVVPQGKTLNEWTDCLTSIEREMDFHTIGVPKHLINSPCGSRKPFLNHLEIFGYPERYDIHLLGLNSLTELHDLAKEFPWIRGVDSGLPIAWAQKYLQLSYPDSPHYSLQWNNKFEVDLAASNTEVVLNICRKEV